MMKKLIIIKDIGRRLSSFPGARNLRSPLNVPVYLEVLTIRSLLAVDGCTALYEVNPKNKDERILLTLENYSIPFEELEEEKNPKEKVKVTVEKKKKNAPIVEEPIIEEKTDVIIEEKKPVSVVKEKTPEADVKKEELGTSEISVKKVKYTEKKKKNNKK